MSRRNGSNIVRTFSDLHSEWQREHRADYQGTSPSDFRRTRHALGGGADAHYYNESRWLQMMEYARDMDRNDWAVGAIGDRLTDNIVRDGFDPEPQTGDTEMDDYLYAKHRRWADDPRQCDAAGKRTFGLMQRHVFRSRIIDGDCFGVNITASDDPKYGRIQLLEGHLCRTPTFNRNKGLVQGIELDDQCEPLNYYFLRRRENPLSRTILKGELRQVAAFDQDGTQVVYHVAKPHRLSMTRGITALHGAFDETQILTDIGFAELIRRKIAASIGLSIETDKASTYSADTALGDRTGVDRPNGYTDLIEEMAPGLILRLRPGQTAKTLGSNNIPGEGYVQHFKLTLQSIGAVVGLPLILILLDAAETNFSGWRGAMDQAKIGFVCEQYLQEVTFCRPAYVGNVRRWIRDDPEVRAAYAKVGDKIFAHGWHYPGWPYVQPLQDAQAAMVRVNTGQSSPRRIAAGNGEDFEEIATESVADTELWIRLAMKATQTLKKEFPEFAQDLHWTQLYHRDFPRGIQLIDTAETPNDSTAGAAAGPPAKKKAG
jgi:lambda family phage portal protein